LRRHADSLGYADYSNIVTLDEESTRDYSRRELGRELEEYATEPMVRGTWAADDGESSNALMLWSLRNMMVPTVFALASGMDALPRAIARQVNMRLAHPVNRVTQRGDGVDVAFTDPSGATHIERFAGCIIATTAGPALAMYPQMDANHRSLYETARYRGLLTIALGLSRPPQDKATYILIPHVEDQDFIAVISDHNKAIGRVPSGKSLYSVLGSHEFLHRSWNRSDEEVLVDAINCVSRYYGDVRGKVEQYQINRWREVVPVVDVGRFKLIAQFKQHLDTSARVQFASDLDRIPGVNGALVSGSQAAQRVVAASPHWLGTAAPPAAA
jgi:oxygen-dependent protoporphyrinogen oxidase